MAAAGVVKNYVQTGIMVSSASKCMLQFKSSTLSLMYTMNNGGSRIYP
jgi:hypothetical protein